MKKYVILMLVVVMGSVLYAQNDKADFKKKGDLIEATYYHDNGAIAQEGTFKDGKLHGIWTSYDAEGNKLAVGNYTLGEKTGKWFFWTNEILREVDYDGNRIASINEWVNADGIVARN